MLGRKETILRRSEYQNDNLSPRRPKSCFAKLHFLRGKIFAYHIILVPLQHEPLYERMQSMKKKQESKQTAQAVGMTEAQGDAKMETSKRKVSKAWEAAQRLKGSVIINDPTLYWR